MIFPRRCSIVPIVLAAVLASAASAAAQQRTVVIPVDSTARVRVTRSGEPSRVRGTFLGADSAAMVVHTGLSRYELPLEGIRKLEVSRGERSVEAGAWRGAQRGFLAGLLVGVVTGTLVMTTTESDDEYVTDELIAGVLMVTSTTGGTVLGTLLGAISPGERWETVPLPRR